MTPLVLAVVIFVVVTGLVGAVAFLLKGDKGQRVNERLDHVVGRNTRKDSSADLLIKQALSELSKKSLLDRLTPEIFRFKKMFAQADINLNPSVLFGVAIGLAFVLGVVMMVLVNPYVAPIGGLVGFMLPVGWLWWKKSSRMGKFAAQLPDAMELVARALRAGHSLAAGLQVVASEMPEPISKEFNRVYEEQNLGIPIEEALMNMCERIPNLDLRFFVTSVAIQRQTGGDLAEILDRIGYIIRQRFKILGQIKALTAEGRLSGLVLVALPIGLFFMMYFMKPDYVSLLWTDPQGIKMSIGAIVSMIVGAISIKKIIDIKV